MKNRISVLYITVPSYFDLEISLIRELDKLVDLTVLLLITPQSKQSSAFEINDLPSISGIYNASEIIEMSKYAHLIPLENLYLYILSRKSGLSIKSINNEIRLFLKDKSFDLIHATSLGNFAALIYPCFSQIKNRLLTIHDPIPHHKLSFIKRFIHELVIYWFRNILLLNRGQTKYFKKRFHFKQPKIYFSRLGVYDYLKSFPVQGLMPFKKNKYILFFGRIEPYKGVDNLIRAFEKSKAIKSGFKLVIAGKGLIKETITNREWIICLNNYIPNELLSRLIKKAAFTVLPYQSATQSGVIMSSYACETPVLVTPVGDLPYATKSISGEDLGYVCDGITDEDIAKGINHMISTPKILIEYKSNIKKVTSLNGELNWRKITSDIECIYKDILNKKNAL